MSAADLYQLCTILTGGYCLYKGLSALFLAIRKKAFSTATAKNRFKGRIKAAISGVVLCTLGTGSLLLCHLNESHPPPHKTERGVAVYPAILRYQLETPPYSAEKFEKIFTRDLRVYLYDILDTSYTLTNYEEILILCPADYNRLTDFAGIHAQDLQEYAALKKKYLSTQSYSDHLYIAQKLKALAQKIALYIEKEQFLGEIRVDSFTRDQDTS